MRTWLNIAQHNKTKSSQTAQPSTNMSTFYFSVNLQHTSKNKTHHKTHGTTVLISTNNNNIWCCYSIPYKWVKNAMKFVHVDHDSNDHQNPTNYCFSSYTLPLQKNSSKSGCN